MIAILMPLFVALAAAPKAPPKAPVYASKLPAGASDEAVIQDLALHALIGEFFDPGHPASSRQTLRIVSDSGHWDSLLEDEATASTVRSALEHAPGIDKDLLAELAAATLQARGGSVADPGTLAVPVIELVASATTPGPRAPKKADEKKKPLWVSLSAIGFAADGTHAALCGAYWLGPGAEGGDVFVFEKRADGWHVQARRPLYRN